MKKNPKQPKLPKAPKTPRVQRLKLKKPSLGSLKAPTKMVGTAVSATVSKIPDRLKFHRKPEADEKLVQALQNLPRITNETVAEHREEVLSGARKYIVPLSHSKRRIIIITSALLSLAIVGFLSWTVLALYKFQSIGSFTYGVTQVMPLPVAKAGGSWVSYESYLFELRHTVHYYETQQHEDFSTKFGKEHLKQLKQQALAQVINDAYTKQLAKQQHVSVSIAEVNDEVALVRSQNRLGSNDQVFRSVLSEFWGWTTSDFQRELRQQFLTQKVTAKLNADADKRADSAIKALNGGTDFATLAKQVSEDPSTKANGGDYGISIDQTNRDIAPAVANQLFNLAPGKYSGIINAGYGLEIVKVTSLDGKKVRAAHILFNFKPIGTYIKPVEAKHQPHRFIKVN
jgi:hypothetical protein